MPKNYDRNLAIQIDPDNIIRNGSANMKYKRVDVGGDYTADEFEIVDFPNGLIRTTVKFAKAIKKLSRQSRVWIRGHGDWRSQTVGGADAETVAKALAANGLPAVRVISCGSCDAAKARKHQNHEVVGTAMANSMHSFAQKLHYILGTRYNIRTTVTGRLRKVSVAGGDPGDAFGPRGEFTFGGTVMPLYEADEVGRKSTSYKGGSVEHQAKSKVVITWRGNLQHFEYFDYTA